MTKLALAATMLAVCLTLAGCPGDEAPPPPARRSSGGAQASSAPRGNPPPSAPRSGGTPLFQLPALDGRTVSVRGPTALFFFTSWCGYCKQAMPEFNRMSNLAQSKGWRVYGIDVNETADKAEWFVQNFRPNFPVLIDQSGYVANQYGVNGFPTFVLIDANGRVTYNAHELPRNF